MTLSLRRWVGTHKSLIMRYVITFKSILKPGNSIYLLSSFIATDSPAYIMYPCRETLKAQNQEINRYNIYSTRFQVTSLSSGPEEELESTSHESMYELIKQRIY